MIPKTYPKKYYVLVQPHTFYGAIFLIHLFRDPDPPSPAQYPALIILSKVPVP